MRHIVAVFLLIMSFQLVAQDETCSKLGAWLWHFEQTGFSNHVSLADSLVNIGVKRVYVKVADGGINSISWPEIVDETLVNIYKTRGIEVYAWSYNYPGNEDNQALALYQAAITGYQGYVVDVESEFDGDSGAINDIFSAFAKSKTDAINNGVIEGDFNLYCTTWGNPMDHNFYISIIDPYVDGYLAQTYVEQWGSSFVEDLEYWIEVGNDEYASMGATKPVHHILAMQDGKVTAERATAFFGTAGAESSIWRIPGGTVTQDTWEVWEDVDWNIDFCETTSTFQETNVSVNVYPNPFTDQIIIEGLCDESQVRYQLYNAFGSLIRDGLLEDEGIVETSDLHSGIYFLRMYYTNKEISITLIKTEK